MNKQKISGYIMAVIGLIILLVHAIGYIFHLGIKVSALTIMGLVFVVVGMNIVRKSEN